MGKEKGAGKREGGPNKKERNTGRTFDFSKHGSRYIALQLSYVGWGNQGFASQDTTEDTVEGQLFAALTKTCLILSRETSNYSRCARTDKGVSALGQVVGLRVRSKLLTGLGVVPAGGTGEDLDLRDKQWWLARAEGEAHTGCSIEDVNDELPYLQVLNAVLPPEIRATAWCPVEKGFNARFACTGRSYRYFFSRGDLDIPAMKEAASYLIGEHDFRNFCKTDTSKPNQTTNRRIIEFDVAPLDDDHEGGASSGGGDGGAEAGGLAAAGGGSGGRYAVFNFRIVATAFLWHQVRAMAAILFAIGRRDQPPDFIKFMLDVKRCPVKPVCQIASEEPLILVDCNFPKDLVRLVPTMPTNARNQAVMDALVSSLVAKAALAGFMHAQLSSRLVRTGPCSESTTMISTAAKKRAKKAAGDAEGEGGGEVVEEEVRVVRMDEVPRDEAQAYVHHNTRAYPLQAPPNTKFDPGSLDWEGTGDVAGGKRKQSDT